MKWRRMREMNKDDTRMNSGDEWNEGGWRRWTKMTRGWTVEMNGMKGNEDDECNEGEWRRQTNWRWVIEGEWGSWMKWRWVNEAEWGRWMKWKSVKWSELGRWMKWRWVNEANEEEKTHLWDVDLFGIALLLTLFQHLFLDTLLPNGNCVPHCSALGTLSSKASVTTKTFTVPKVFIFKNPDWFCLKAHSLRFFHAKFQSTSSCGLVSK